VSQLASQAWCYWVLLFFAPYGGHSGFGQREIFLLVQSCFDQNNEPVKAMQWLSMGENCLPDDILKRHGRKSFSTPFSPCRSNIDYVLQLEREGYDQLLDPVKMVVGDAWGKRVIRSTTVINCAPLFDPAHRLGFEFTHHDPIASAEDRESFRRKIERLAKVKGSEDVVFLYHHRRNKNSDLAIVRSTLAELIGHYESENARCNVVLFQQTLVAQAEDRRLESLGMQNGVIEFVLHTQKVWGGTVADEFWARTDDDLLQDMLQQAEASTVNS
jgi:hypothetical protein